MCNIHPAHIVESYSTADRVKTAVSVLNTATCIFHVLFGSTSQSNVIRRENTCPTKSRNDQNFGTVFALDVFILANSEFEKLFILTIL